MRQIGFEALGGLEQLLGRLQAAKLVEENARVVEEHGLAGLLLEQLEARPGRGQQDLGQHLRRRAVSHRGLKQSQTAAEAAVLIGVLREALLNIEKHSAASAVVVTLDRDGHIYMDQAALSYEDFRATFPAFVRTKRPSGVYLRADGRVPYADVVQVLAVIRASGVNDVGLVAEPETVAR